MSKMLVLAETDGHRIGAATRPALAFAQEWARETGGPFDLLLILGTGEDDRAAEQWAGFGAGRVVCVGPPTFAHPVADQIAAVCVQAMQQTGAASLAGAATSFGRDVLPRVAGLLDLPMVADVIQLRREADVLYCRRPMYAGQAIATVRVAGGRAVFGVRPASYGPPTPADGRSGTESLDIADSLDITDRDSPAGTTWVWREAASQTRPELTSARVVVAGGRPLGDGETFERLVGGLADALGGAVGATGGATGLVSSDLLIGQTGKTVTPELYIAAGISGSDQHVAGMRDSQTIVAINTDPQAAMFQSADYGLVADVHRALPEMIERLRQP